MTLCSPKTRVKWSHPVCVCVCVCAYEGLGESLVSMGLFVRGYVSGWAAACGTILPL